VLKNALKWFGDQSGAPEKVPPAAAFSLEVLEPRVLLDADLIGTQPLSCLRVAQDNAAIVVVDLNQETVGSQESDPSVIATLPACSGQAEGTVGSVENSDEILPPVEADLGSAGSLAITGLPQVEYSVQTGVESQAAGSPYESESAGLAVTDQQDSTSLSESLPSEARGPPLDLDSASYGSYVTSLDSPLPAMSPVTHTKMYQGVDVEPTTAPVTQEFPIVGFPSSYDLRTSGDVSPVKNQAGAGTCWIFATYGSLESTILVDGRPVSDFSENHLKNYHGFDPGPTSGGNSFESLAYLSRWDGPVSEAADPYHDYDDRPSPGGPPQYYVREMLEFNTADELKNGVMTQGGVVTYMYIDGAYYNSSTYTYYYSGAPTTNHAVTIVGWDDAKPVPGAPGPGAWLIKNSWSTGWGDAGYFWLSYYDTSGGKNGFCFCDAVPASTYQKVYFYDYFGSIGTFNAPYGFNAFTATSEQDLRAVQFWTQADGATYDLRIYDTFSGGSLTGLLGSATGTSTYAGLHTIDLPASVHLAAGNDFYVYLYLTNGGTYPLAVDYASPGWDSASTASPGQSYYSPNGTSWTDLTTWRSTANLCIKALVTAVAPPEIAVFGNTISIADGDITPSSSDGTDFGSVPVGGTPVVRTFTVQNNGTGTLALESLTAPQGFTVTEGLPATLAPGASDTFTVRLETTVQGTRRENVIIRNDDNDEHPFNFAINGVVLGPEITVLGNGASLADGDLTPSGTDGTDFGSVAQGGAGTSHTFTVRNDGTATLTLGAVAVPTGFTVTETLSASLAPGASDTFTVRLDVATQGDKTGSVSFANNDDDENPFNFQIRGTVAFQSVDDMESYDDAGHRIYDTWIDGWTNGTGSTVGYLTAPFAERTIVHGGAQSMPLYYDNDQAPFYSEASRTFASAQNWTAGGMDALGLWVRGRPVPFVQTGPGSFTLGGAGHDIWDNADDFRFAYLSLSGDGSITARVDSLMNTNGWAKAGVMIRQSLTDGSAFAAVVVTPGNSCSFQWRTTAGGSCSSTGWSGTAVTAPYWVRLTRSGNTFSAQTSPDGVTWPTLGTSQTIAMGANVYIGLAVTSHNTSAATTGEFSNVATIGAGAGPWQGIWLGNDPPLTNDPANMYVAIQDVAGHVGVVPSAGTTLVNASAWTQWAIPLSSFTGVDLTQVKTLYLGVGNRQSPAVDGSGLIFVDDIVLGGAEISVLGNNAWIVDGDTTPEALDGTDFGNATGGGAAVIHTFRVRNEGLATLTLGTPTVPSGFAVAGLASSLSPGAYDDFTVTLNTTTPGIKSGDVSIPSNDGDENPFNFRITGWVNPVGGLDTSFADTGKVTMNIGPSGDWGYSVACQSDGKIVVAGYTTDGSNVDFAVARYNSNGSLDTSFDGDGKVRTPVGSSSDFAYSVALQPDGKIVVAGYAYVSGGGYDFAVVRYNPNGSLDTSFDGDGKVTTPIGTSDDYGYSVAIQPDGKIVVAGYSYNGSNYDFAVVRYNPNGSLDTSFDGDGKVPTPIGSGDDHGYGVAIQSNGKIVVAGDSYNGSNYDFALVRYNSDGSLDTSFDGDGKVVTPIGSSSDYGRSVALQSDGKIVVAGYSSGDFALARYNSSNGSLDTSFDADGKVTTPIGSSSDYACGVAVQSDGKIVAAGYTWTGSTWEFALARYNANGSLDTSFDADGKVTTRVGTGDDSARGIALPSDGKIVVAGYSIDGSNYDFALARYNANGSLDTSFDADGKVTTSFGSASNYGYSVAVQSDGKMVLAGYTYNGSNDDFALVRYNANGSLDTSFDGDGVVTTDFGNWDDGYSIALQPDGKIVVAGSSGGDFALARYNPNGSLDTTFDGDGKVVTPIGSSGDYGYSVALQSDGKIVVAGYSYNGSNYDFALARYNTNGSLDTSFDGDGKVTTPIGLSDEYGRGVAVQSDGRIVVAGYSYNGNDNDFALVRYNANGSLDTSFHGDGKVTTPFGSWYEYGYSVALQPDGKIVVGGSAWGDDSWSYDFALARYNSNGSLDTSFDGDGKVVTPVGSGYDFGYSIALQSDGKIVLAGESSNGSNYDFALVRYDADGSVDTSFGVAGRVTTALGSGDDRGRAVALGAGGKIVVGGYSYEGSDYDFALARYLGVCPEITVLGNGVSITDGAATPSAADGTYFGSVALGGSPVSRTFTVRNDGDAPLTLGAVSLPAGFALTEGLPASLAPGASDTFTVTMDTSTSGSKSGEISLVNDDPDESPFNFQIYGHVAAREYSIDDMESYDDAGNRIFDTWIDGWTNGTGSQVGYLDPPFAERTIVHGGAQSMPFYYDNDQTPFYSEASRTFATAQNWTLGGSDTLSLWVRGQPVRLVQTGPGAFTVSGAGHDIFGTADDFRFVYVQLSGDGSITAQVDSIVNTNVWAKAGVMIRESLAAGSKYAAVYATPGKGVRFQARLATDGSAVSDTPVATPEQMALRTPVWVRLVRSGDTLTGFYSTDGVSWTAMSWNPQTVSMSGTVYIGLAVTSHNAAEATTAQFSNVSTAGTVTGSWQGVWVGDDPDRTNDADSMYVAVQDAAGHMTTVTCTDAPIVNAMAWTQWRIPLSSFVGVDLASVKKMYLGVGNRYSPMVDGKGLVFVDDIALLAPEITVLGNYTSIRDGDITPSKSDGTDFGVVAQGATTISQVFTVRNETDGTLTLGPVTVPTGYTLTEGLSASLPPWGTDTFTVSLDTATVGTKSGEVSFVTDGIVHGGAQSMPFFYDNTLTPYYSEAYRTFAMAQNWTVGGSDTLSLWVRGRPVPFVQTGPSAFTVSGAGHDIWDNADDFRFVYQPLSGDGSITARVDGLGNTDPWAKAGVMIRQSLTDASACADVVVTPSNSCAFQWRDSAGGPCGWTWWSGAPVTAPYWVRLTRSGDTLTAETSANGVTWTALGTPRTIAMGANVYIGLAVTSHNTSVATTAQFSNVATTGGVSGSWQGIWLGDDPDRTNSPSNMYVAVEDAGGNVATVSSLDPLLVNATAWTQWQIPLSSFAGVNLASVKKLYLGVGNRSSPAVDGQGLVFVDDVAVGTVAGGMVIDDFESYNDGDNRIFETWIDGYTDGRTHSQVGYRVAPFAERAGGLFNFRITGTVAIGGVVIDDFESYNDTDNLVWDTWIDGIADGRTHSEVGYPVAPFMEQTMVHGGAQSMPFFYDNTLTPYYSEAYRTFATAQNWTVGGSDTLSLWVRGRPVPWVQTGPSAFTISGAGHDIWDNADDFRFVYKQLSGDGSVTARVDGLGNTDPWAKAGVMIRQSLTDGSAYADMVVTPSNSYAFQWQRSSCAFQWRESSGGACGWTGWPGAPVTAPYWVRLTRSGDTLTAATSPDGVTWTTLGTPRTIALGANVYIGLAVTSHNTSVATTAQFSNVATTGGVSGSWQGIWLGDDPDRTNSPSSMYVAVEDTSGHVATSASWLIVNETTWTQMDISLSSFAGVDLTHVKKLYLGVGNRSSPTPDGQGWIFVDDIVLFRREVSVRGNGVLITDGDTTPSTTDGTAFGSVAQYGAAISRVFTIRNDGGSWLTLQSLTVPTGYTATDAFSETWLAPGAEYTFTVRLDTATPGVKSGDISFATNDLDENPFNFAISGTVTPPSPPQVTISVAPVSPAQAATPLQNGVPAGSLSGSAASERLFQLDVPAGAQTLEIKISGGTGDADLYVKRGGAPTISSYDYRPYQAGNSEIVTVSDPTEGPWFVMIRGYGAFADVTLVATYALLVMPLQNGVPVSSFSGSAASERLFRLDVPVGAQTLEIKISGGTGDADLYVKRGDAPTPTSYDYRPYVVGNNETVTVSSPAGGTWFVMVRGYGAYSGVTLQATYAPQVALLQNGGPVNNVSGSAASEQMFRLDVPVGAQSLEIKISGGTGDADLYVRRDALPTTTSYDYRPYLAGNNETVTVSSPAGGAWFVMVRGSSAFAGVTLQATYGPQVTALQNGVPVNGLSGSAASERMFRVDVPAGVQTLEIKISGGTGDADLYVRRDALPTTTTYDYRPYQTGNNETVGLSNPAGGAWFVMVRGYGAFADVTLQATYVPQVTPLQNGVPVGGLFGSAGSERLFQLDVPAGARTLEIRISGGTGDADLYVRRGAAPTTASWDSRPYLTGNNETVTVFNPAGGSWFIMVYGHQQFADVTVQATYSPGVTRLQNAVPVNGLSGSEQLFQLDVPAGTQTLEIRTLGGAGEADLYVKRDALPTTASFDYASSLAGNYERVTVSNPAAGSWFVMVRGDDQLYSDVTVVAAYTPDVTTLRNAVAVRDLSGIVNSERLFRLEVPAGVQSLEIRTFNGVGDVDLYVKRGAAPTTSSYDYHPYVVGNNETVAVSSPQAGTWYVMVRGFAAYSGVTLLATYSPERAAVMEDGVANLVYTFTRSVPDPDNPLTVSFSVAGTATFSTDYTQTGAATFSATAGTVTIPANQTSAMVTVDPTADTTAELDETVLLTVTAGTGYTIGSPAAANGTIQNDDASANLAFGKPAVASTSYTGLPASNATDGSGSTRWSSQFSNNEWIYVDLGSVYTFNRVVLRWETAYGRGYKLQVSNDASTWSDVYTTTTGDGGVDDITLSTPASGRYVRMLGTQRATTYGYSLYEFEVYAGGGGPEITALGNAVSITDGDATPSAADGTDFGSVTLGGPAASRTFTVRNDGTAALTLGTVTVPTGFTLTEGLSTTLAAGASDTFTVQLDTVTLGTKSGEVSFTTNDADENPFNFAITGVVHPVGNLALGKAAVASSTYTGFPAANVADGNTSTRWASQSSDSQWIYVDLSEVEMMTRILLRWEAAYGRGYKLQVSNDASTWSDVYSTTTGDGGIDDITLSTPASGRYVRMLGTQRATTFGYSLYELEVYGGSEAPEITALGNAVSITDGDATPSATDGTDFGSVTLGGPAATRTFTVRNDGGVALTLGTVTVPTGFTLTEGLSTSLAAGASDTFTVQLDTATLGTKSGEVSFTTNDADENPFNFAITGVVHAVGNLALGKTAAASSTYTGFPAANVTDGNTSTRWASQSSDSQWIYVDLGEVEMMTRIVLRWEAAYGRGYKLQVSNDASTWSDVYSTTTGDGGIDDITLSTPASGRYVRMLGTQRATAFGYSLYELEVYGGGGAPEITVLGNTVSITDGDTTPSAADGTDFGSVTLGGPAASRTFTVRNDGTAALTLGAVTVPTGFTLTEGLSTSLAAGASDTFTVQLDTVTLGTKSGEVSFATNDSDENPFNFTITGIVSPVGNLALGKAAVASSTYTGFPASNVTDGNTSTRWSSQSSDSQWIYVDLGSVSMMTRIVLRWEAAYGRGYKLQVSNDASTWSDVYSTTTGDGGIDDITLSTPASGRYVRMLGTQRATTFGYSLYELEVYGGSGAPEITVLGNAVSITDGDATPSAADGTDFGSVTQGGPTASRTFTVRNDGTAALTLGAVTVPTGFTLTEGLSTTLAAGASDTFTVRLDTATLGTKSGEVSFTTNDSDENPFNFAITGIVSPVGNLALGTTAVASTTFTGFPASNVTDGNTGTRWASQYSDSEWIYVDLGSISTIGRIVLRWEAAYGRGYRLQVSSDASTWSDVYSTTTGDGDVDDITLSTPASGRYVRMLGTQRATTYGYSLYELEVYAGLVGNLALTKPAVASTSYTGLPASNATDGNMSTRWSSQYSDSEWIYVDLGSVYTIRQVVLRWEGAYGKGYKLQVSNDASTWSDVYSTTTSDGGVDDITLSSPASGRYVRLLGTQRATTYGYSLWEFEVYS